MRRSRWLHKEDSDVAKELAKPVVIWLNTPEGAAHPVAKVIDLTRECWELFERTTAVDFPFNKLSTHKRKINAICRKYPVAFKFEVLVGNLPLDTYAHRKWKYPSFRTPRRFPGETVSTSLKFWELSLRRSLEQRQGAMYFQLWRHVCELSGENGWGRIRRCQLDSCRRYFYAKFPHQLFHEEKCKQKNLRSKETFKAKRREYMRDYYRKNLSSVARRKR